MPVGVRAANDGGQQVERGVAQREILDERIEAAALAAVRHMRARDVVWHGIALLGLREDLRRRHVVELCERIDEALDEPGTRDAIDLRALSRDPARAARNAPMRTLRHRGKTLGAPRLDAALEV